MGGVVDDLQLAKRPAAALVEQDDPAGRPWS